MSDTLNPTDLDSEIDRIVDEAKGVILDYNEFRTLRYTAPPEVTKAAIQVIVAREVLTELEAALTEYNRLQEHYEEPSVDLKFGNGYLLKRIDQLKAAQKGEQR